MLNYVDHMLIYVRHMPLCLPYTISCVFMFCMIRNGGMSTSPLIGTYCGTTFDPVIRSHSNHLYLKFSSNAYRTSRGFQAFYDGTLSGKKRFPLCDWTVSNSRSMSDVRWIVFLTEQPVQNSYVYSTIFP